jgi:vitamin K-dependent gamma-carboxylase-like protein
MTALQRLTRAALHPLDAASLAFFRIAFGLLMCGDAIRKLALGRVGSDFLEPRLLFKYVGFEWVQLWPGNGIYIHFIVMAACGLMIAIGFLTRFFALLFALLFSYAFLLDQMHYLNHYYLIILVSFILVVIPTNRVLSVDAGRKGRRETVPAWCLWLLRLQIAIPYVYGGIAKLETDWLSGVPMYIWLAEGPPFGAKLASIAWMPRLLAWSGTIFDLLVVPAIFWKRTRLFAFIAAIAFHAFNHALFKIGVFPFLMLGATTIFFSPSWPRRVRFLAKRLGIAQEPEEGRGSSVHAAAGDGIKREEPEEGRGFVRLTLAAVALYALLQLILPFREYLYPGNSDWTEEGHCFAWKMKLRSKVAKALLVIKNPRTGELGTVEPDRFFRLGDARRMAQRPDFILQFAHYMKDEFRKRGGDEIEIYGRSLVSLNGRLPADMIDQAVDLSKVEMSLRHAPWILPLTEPRPTVEDLQAREPLHERSSDSLGAQGSTPPAQ